MKKILFYATFGGYGHIARDLAISRHIKNHKICIVSGIRWKNKIPNNISFEHISEVPKSQIIGNDGVINFASFYKGKTTPKDYGQHIVEYINVLKKFDPDVVVCDLTSEIAFITKLLGYKVITIYETGTRNDLRHILAYNNSDGILVPYPKGFTRVDYLPSLITKKMFFSGGFSRFDGMEILSKREAQKKINQNNPFILVISGKGDYAEKLINNSILALKNLKNIKSIIVSSSCRQKKGKDIQFIKWLDDDLPYYLQAAEIVICGTGYGTVMENCYFGVPMITIPLSRPYNEQAIKAENLSDASAGELILESKVTSRELLNKIREILSSKTKTKEMRSAQKKILNGKGALKAAKYITSFIN